MTLPPGFIDDLLSRTSLAKVVARKVSWDARRSTPARGDYWAPCPFHTEKTASFHVDDAKGFYYCFGCQAKGDAIGFLRETENLGFMEAVETLARDAGIEMPARAPETRARDDRRGRLAAAMEAALGFFRLQLASAAGARARAYLDGRALAPAMRERFEIGFAPESWTALIDHLKSKGFAAEEVAAVGLSKINERGPHDFFRNRVMFPIRDGRGRVVAFGGRTLREDGRAPKYLNSPETELFDKGRTLFNLAGARKAAAGGAPLIVAEGYMDVIALVQAGFEGALAPMGTAITEDQIEALWRIAPEPLVALDGDRAGLAAAQRLIDLALPRLVAGRSLRFVLMPQGQDPDDLLRAGGPAAMEQLIGESQPIVELLWRRETDGQPLDSPERRAALDARLGAHLGRIRDERLRSHTGAAFRERTRALFAPPPRPPRGGSRPGSGRGRPQVLAPGTATAEARRSLLAQTDGAAQAEARLRESAILFGLLNQPALLPRFETRLERMTFLCDDLGALRDTLLSCLDGALSRAHADPCPSGETASAVNAADSRTDLVARLVERLGHDPSVQLAALGHLRASRHFWPEADPAAAATAVEEEIARHQAILDRAVEVREAVEVLAVPGAAPDENLTWRLRQAAEAHERAVRDPLVDREDDSEDAAALSRHLQEMIDAEVWRKRSPNRSNR